MKKTKVRMIAIAEHTYADKVYKPGDRYEADVIDVEILGLTGFARRIEDEQGKGTYRRRDLRAEK